MARAGVAGAALTAVGVLGISQPSRYPPRAPCRQTSKVGVASRGQVVRAGVLADIRAQAPDVPRRQACRRYVGGCCRRSGVGGQQSVPGGLVFRGAVAIVLVATLRISRMSIPDHERGRAPAVFSRRFTSWSVGGCR